MNILILGAGFIGSHLADYLAEKGHAVSILDRFPRLPADHEGNIQVFYGDIRNRETVMEAIRRHDAYINLAGILGTSETISDPGPSIDTNIHGALNCFEAGLPRPDSPAGIPGVQITVGNHFMNNTYAITKTAAERFALMFNRELGGRITVIRGLNVYGEGQKHKPVKKIIPNFIRSALTGSPIEIFGDGEQVMDMIYVRDMVMILSKAVTIDHGCFDRIFEAGTGRRTTVNEIARIINDLSGNKAGVIHKPMRAGEPERSVVLGNPKTLEPLGVRAENLTPLEAGLKQTIQWYRAHPEFLAIEEIFA